jgi:hypothetical protein
MSNFRDKRYIIGVDPEKNVNLKGLGEILNTLLYFSEHLS